MTWKRRLWIPMVATAIAWPQAASATDPFVQKLQTATAVFEELMAMPDSRVPEILLEDTNCIAVIPSVIKGAFVLGGRRGRGVMSCRIDGSWSPFIFVKVTGGSVGFQAGGQSTDLVLFFLTERGARSLVNSKFILGADASVAAGPAGRSAAASTDLRLKAEIYSYARSRGLFAGAAVDGARLAPDVKWTRNYYGERVWADEVLFEGEAPRMTAEGRAFLAALP